MGYMSLASFFFILSAYANDMVPRFGPDGEMPSWGTVSSFPQWLCIPRKKAETKKATRDDHEVKSIFVRLADQQMDKFRVTVVTRNLNTGKLNEKSVVSDVFTDPDNGISSYGPLPGVSSYGLSPDVAWTISNRDEPFGLKQSGIFTFRHDGFD